MKQPLCLLMLGGDAPSGLARQALDRLAQRQPYVVAADSGAAALAAAGVWPQLVVGDGDSLDGPTRELCREHGAQIVALPREKDLTDGEAAFAAACAAGYRHFAVLGAMGGSLDHHLGNLLLPLAYRDNWQSLTFYGDDYLAGYCFGLSLLKGQPGDTVSLIPLSATVRGLSLSGFRYPLHKHSTTLGESRCLRNELAEPEARVSFDGGIMLVIHFCASLPSDAI